MRLLFGLNYKRLTRSKVKQINSQLGVHLDSGFS